MTSKFSRTCCSEQTLASFEIFQSLPDEAVQAYSKRCFWKRFAKNETLIEYNDTTRDVYFISSGRARATYYAACGREISFRDLDPGEMFGEIAAIDALPRSVSVTALTDMLVAVMPSAVFRELLCQHDQSSTAMMLRLAMLIRRLSERVVELSALGCSTASTPSCCGSRGNRHPARIPLSFSQCRPIPTSPIASAPTARR